MRKKALLAVLTAMVLLLSGCSLIVKDEAVDNATVIIKMGDKEITKETVKKETQNQLDSMAYYYSLYGYSYDTSDAEHIAEAQQDAIDNLKNDLALTAKAKELGLDQLTDEELETVKTEAQKSFDDAVDYVKTYMLTDTEGMDEEAIKQAADEKIKELGYSLDNYIETETKSLIDNKLRDYAIKDVTVTDEEIQADYEEHVAEDKETYAEDAGTWASEANNATTLYYTPAGIRRVKQILIKFKDEDQTAIDEANNKLTEANTARTTAQAKVDSANETLGTEGIDDETKTKAEADLNAAHAELEEADKAITDAAQALTEARDKAFANLDEETDAILAQLAEGADWQTLMDEKNQDPGMKNNEKGYAVSADMTDFDSAFVEAAMALEKPGDISGKVKGTSYGYYIIRYESDEPEGPVALDAVKEEISSSLLSSKQSETYEAAVEKWVEEAGITVDLNALKD